MSRLRIFIAVTAAVLCTAASATAADPTAFLPAGWSHAQINVTGKNGRTHTLIFDRGRVLANNGSSLTLREQDGSVLTIQVAPNAVVRVNGRAGSLSQIAPGFHALTRGTDGRPALLVRATSPPRKAVKKTA
jgi:hypothetical protein